jgi:hypothetical protein
MRVDSAHRRIMMDKADNLQAQRARAAGQDGIQ